MSPKPQTSKTTEAAAEDLPKTSDSNFKNSAFGKLAQQPSAFSAAPGTSSPFGASSGKSSWLSKPKPSAPAGIENKTPSIFGGSNTAKPSGFGGSLGATPKLFGPTSTSGTGGGFGGKGFGQGTAITGLKKTEAKPFGSKEVASKSEKSENANDEEGGDKENGDKTEEHNGADRRTSQPLLQPQGPPETGEENEDNVYVGRAKLYTFQDEAGKKSWQERGAGVLKLNMTREEPRKARFVLRADGTHRLLLNAALLATMPFGTGTKPLGKMPEDGRLYFQAPTASGEVESYILRVSAKCRPVR
jgi:Ran-binding protein 3